MNDPFHSGERAIQEMTGERSTAVLNATVITNTIPQGAVGFISQQEICILGSASGPVDIWASVVAGPRGFAQAGKRRKSLTIKLENHDAASWQSTLHARLGEGDSIGILFIELSTRRRLRVNGYVAKVSKTVLTVAVEQAFPNCPKYIQRRKHAELPGPGYSKSIEEGESLTEEHRAWITCADTCFVASAHPDGPLDISHRGGPPGFVRLEDDALRIPDYPGNSLFNTLGNFRLNPHAGITFVDYAGNRQLKMSGEVHLDLQGGEDSGETGGTGRWWEFRPKKWVVAPLNRAFGWEFIDASPFNPAGT